MKILVTPRSVTRGGHPSLQKIHAAGYEVVCCKAGAQPSEEELRLLLPNCSGYVAGAEPITAYGLETADKLRVISRNGTGVDNIDLAATKARGITVLRAEGANARGVAELTIGQLFALSRGLPAAGAATRSGIWERGAQGIELEGKLLGLLGCGRVGKLVATLAVGCGMEVLAFDTFADPSFVLNHFRFAPLEEVITRADFLSLHCPPAADGQPLLDPRRLARVKQGAFLINTARYDVFDADAVLAALDTGQLAGLAMDVFDTEPPTDSRLAKHPRTLATPHIGGFTRESIERAMTVAVDNLLTSLGKQVP